MSIKSAYLFRCPNLKCSDYTVLPRQSHLGNFDGLSNPSKGIWPINYLCRRCELGYEISESMIHREGVETLALGQLVRYDFSSDQLGFLMHCEIYCKENEAYNEDHPDMHEPVESVLKPSRFWQGSYEQPINVSVSTEKRTGLR